MVDVGVLCDDLLDERSRLLARVEPLDAAGWAIPTPAVGWTVRDQVAHLVAGDDQARHAVADPEAFARVRDEVMARPGGAVAPAGGSGTEESGDDLAGELRRSGERFTTAARAADPSRRVPWFGPDMSLASAVTARTMETWAHGVDVAEALGAPIGESPALVHVADLGWRTVGFSFAVAGRPAPGAPVRLELDDGAFVRGPADAADVVRGPLLDLCLVVTRRRHPDDTALVAVGPVASEWLAVAQCYAGPPGPGPRRRSSRAGTGVTD